MTNLRTATAGEQMQEAEYYLDVAYPPQGLGSTGRTREGRSCQETRPQEKKRAAEKKTYHRNTSREKRGGRRKGKKTKKYPKHRREAGRTRRAESLVPYTCIYNEMAMIRRKQEGKDADSYSAAYRIGEAAKGETLAADPSGLLDKLIRLLDGFGKARFQFFTINQALDPDEYLKQVFLPVRRNVRLDPLIRQYNNLIRENLPLGHNNMTQHRYIVFSLDAYTPEEALEKLSRVEERAARLFYSFGKMELVRLTPGERLSLIYSVFNMGSDQFGARASMRCDNFDLQKLWLMHQTTKDLVAPRSAKESKTCLCLNGGLWVRAFFLSSFPAVLSENLIPELTGISSRMVYSCLCEPLDAAFGYEQLKKRVSGNTVVSSRRDQTTLQDRKEGRVVTSRRMLEKTEEAYFSNAALPVVTDALSSGEKLFLCTFLIILYADSRQDLERDTKLLELTASRFALQIRTFDYKQKDALQSALPLASRVVDAGRVFSSERLGVLSLHGIFAGEKRGLFAGMNAINDNLIFTSKKNTAVPAGLIAGSRGSGKTYAVKREIGNILISSRDVVFLISPSKEIPRYESFVYRFGGRKFTQGKLDPLYMPSEYGLIGDGAALKAEFLAALFSGVLKLRRNAPGSAALKAEQALLGEAQALTQSPPASWEAMEEFLYEKGKDFPLAAKAFSRLERTYTEGDPMEGNRFCWFVADTPESMLILLDGIWSMELALKQKNISSAVLIDGIDAVLMTPEGARYIEHLLRLANILGNPMTLVLQQSALFAQGELLYSFKNILPRIGQVKLLNQGPVERRLFSEELGIQPSLMPYITNVSPGQGLLVSAERGVPFNDNVRQIYSFGGSLHAVYESEGAKEESRNIG